MNIHTDLLSRLRAKIQSMEDTLFFLRAALSIIEAQQQALDVQAAQLRQAQESTVPPGDQAADISGEDR